MKLTNTPKSPPIVSRPSLARSAKAVVATAALPFAVACGTAQHANPPMVEQVEDAPMVEEALEETPPPMVEQAPPMVEEVPPMVEEAPDGEVPAPVPPMVDGE